MKKNNILFFLLMHAGFFIYSLYSLAGKAASREPFLSGKFILCCILIFLILGTYALLWQQVLKHFQLSVAIANKAVTILWGMLWGHLFFSEQITFSKAAGAAVILAGILVLCGGKEYEN
jgi:drug/metabolite transporter (DMT)-like permease